MWEIVPGGKLFSSVCWVSHLFLKNSSFIGTKSAAADGAQLRELGITHIVNVGGCHFEVEGVMYLKKDSVDGTLDQQHRGPKKFTQTNTTYEALALDFAVC
jgi:hypothetical protein